MTRAFVKDMEESADGELDLPERPVSAQRNLVTPAGLAQIEAAIRSLEGALHAAQAAEDPHGIASHRRDLRYWRQRLASAELAVPPPGSDRVRFGSRVTLRLADASERTVTIVGEDEADPALGKLAYVAPVAAAMIGAAVGEQVDSGEGLARVVAID